MDERESGLSKRAATILGLIAEGRSYDQILQRQPDLTYFEIFAAAREALDLIQMTNIEAGPATLPEPQAEVGERVTLPTQPQPLSPTPPAGPIVLPVVQAGGKPEAAASLMVESTADPKAEPTPAKRLPAYIERARATHGRAWARWTRDEDARLTALFNQGITHAEMVRELGRQPGAVRSRLLKLGLISAAEDGEDAPARITQGASLASAPPASSPHIPPPTEPSPAMVPGWESFRDRLAPDQETP